MKTCKTIAVTFFALAAIFLQTQSYARGNDENQDPEYSTIPGSEDLADFDITLYDEKTQIPLDNLVALDGTPYDSEVLRGKHVLLNLWVTLCPYCRAEKPSIERLYRGQESGAFTVLAVSLGEEPETVRQYMDENRYGFPAAVDREGRLRDGYAPRLPTSYVLDPEGNILARINGEREWDGERALGLLRLLTAGGSGRQGEK